MKNIKSTIRDDDDHILRRKEKKVRKEKLMTTDGENKSSRMKRPLGAMRSGLTRNFL